MRALRPGSDVAGRTNVEYRQAYSKYKCVHSGFVLGSPRSRIFINDRLKRMAQCCVRGTGVRIARLTLERPARFLTETSKFRLPPLTVMRYLSADSYESFIMECDNDFEVMFHRLFALLILN